ncbi:MAG: calcium-binding protein [Xenococcaceae cyanobacterium MO_188.B19]|nr:calcium-binding protein [Xenococcaceae cyanobacterium MO_188.B19]
MRSIENLGESKIPSFLTSKTFFASRLTQEYDVDKGYLIELLPGARFQSNMLPGTYVYVGEEENNSLNELIAGNDIIIVGDDSIMGHLVEKNSLNNLAENNQSTDIVTDQPFPIVPINGTPRDDNLEGSPGNDVINGLAGNDLIWGLAGNDVLNGGSGEDIVIGGEGDDLIIGGLDSDTLTGSEGNDIFRGTLEELDDDTISDFNSDDLIIVDGVEFTQNDIAITSSSLDFIQDNVRSSSRIIPFFVLEIKVPEENKTIELVFRGKIAEDFLNSGGKELPNFKVTTIQAEPGFFVPPQTIISLEEKPIPTQPKIINGTPKDDRLVGDNDLNLIRGFRGDDTLIGKAREDTLIGGKGDDTLKGGSGQDVLRGNRGDDYLFGGAGRDTLSGGRGDDYLFGDRGNDDLRGNRGNDILAGGRGSDVLKGGAGADIFVLSSDSGTDTIIDFQDGIDRLSIDDDDDFDDLKIFARGTSTIIEDESGNEIAILKHIDVNQITQADFIETDFDDDFIF